MKNTCKLTALFVALAAVVTIHSNADATIISINLTRSGAPTETGFTNWESGDNSLPSNLSIAGLTLSAPSTGINAGTTLRSINRGGNDGYTGTLPNLTQTWWGQRATSTGPGGYLTIDISGLAAGNYTFTSYHLDQEDQSGEMKVQFSDNDGVSFTDVVPAFDIPNYAGGGSVPVPGQFASAPAEATFNFTSTGADIQIRFTNTASSNSSEAFALVNGFEIIPEPASLILLGLGSVLMLGWRKRA